MPTDDDPIDDNGDDPIGEAEADPIDTDDEDPDGVADDEVADDDESDRTATASNALVRRIAVALVLTLVAGVAGWYFLVRDDGLSTDAVLAVNGEELTEVDFARRLDLLTALYGVEQPDPTTDEYNAFRRDSAKSMAVGLALDDAAAARGVAVGDRTVTDAFARYIEQRYPVGGRDTFIQELGNVGVTEAEVVAEFRRTLITRLLYNDVVEDVAVTDDELVGEYQARAEELAISETRTLRHLVVSTEEAAEAALDRIAGGEDFAAVASEISLDAATAEDGGSLGVLSADMLDPAFAEPAFRAPVGEVFGPVLIELEGANQSGWYLGVVDEIFPPRTPDLDEIAEELRTRIEIERELEQWRQFLEETIVEADIAYAEDYEPENPEAPPPVVVPDPLSAATTTSTETTTTEGGDDGG